MGKQTIQPIEGFGIVGVLLIVPLHELHLPVLLLLQTRVVVLRPPFFTVLTLSWNLNLKEIFLTLFTHLSPHPVHRDPRVVHLRSLVAVQGELAAQVARARVLVGRVVMQTVRGLLPPLLQELPAPWEAPALVTQQPLKIASVDSGLICPLPWFAAQIHLQLSKIKPEKTKIIIPYSMILDPEREEEGDTWE